MPTKAKIVYQFFAWSYSRLQLYFQCPLKAKLIHLAKMKEPTSAVMERGKLIHEMAANYISGKLKALPKELKLFTDEMKLFRKLKAPVEVQWTFDRKWQPILGKDAWFSKEAWLRIVVDTYKLMSPDFLHIVDHKTGKIRLEQKEQLELYAIAGFLLFPEVKRILCRFWYLDQGEEVTSEFTRDQLPLLQAKWDRMVKPMLNDKGFAPRPNQYCRFCHFRSENGGPCKF